MSAGGLDTSFYERSRRWGLAQTAWPIAGLAVALAIAAGAANPVTGALAFAAIGWLYYRIYFPLHEASHGNLLPTRSENRIAGDLMAALLATPFEGFRREHAVHHRAWGSRADPAHVDYLVGFRSRAALLRFLLLPLVGGTLFLKVLHNWGGLAEQRERPASPRDLRGLVSIVAVQGALALVVTSGFAELWRYPVFVLAPGATLFLFLSRLRMFLEHAVLDDPSVDPEAPPRPIVRTIPARFPETWLITGLGFCYHAEHHRYPGVPGLHLPRLHRSLGEAARAPERYAPSYRSALRRIWIALGRERTEAARTWSA